MGAQEIKMVLGVVLIVVGLLFARFPALNEWVNRQTNLRAARAHGGDEVMKRYEHNLRILRYTFPLFFLIVGTLTLVDGLG